jgi:hypothetical protein
MTDKRKHVIEKELQRIKLQLNSVSGVKRRHVLLKKQINLKKELKNIKKGKK